MPIAGEWAGQNRNNRMPYRRNPNIPRGTETWGDWGGGKAKAARQREQYRRNSRARSRALAGSGKSVSGYNRGFGRSGANAGARFNWRRGMGRPTSGLAGGRGGQLGPTGFDNKLGELPPHLMPYRRRGGRGGQGAAAGGRGGQGLGGMWLHDSWGHGGWDRHGNRNKPGGRGGFGMGMGGGMGRPGTGLAGGRGQLSGGSGGGRVIDKYSRWGGPNQRPDGKQTLPNFRPVEQGRRWDAGSSGGRGQTTGAWAGDRHRGGKYGGEWDGRGGASDWQGRFKVGNWRGPTVTPGEVPGGSFMAGGQNARKGLDQASSRRRAQRRRNQAGPQRGPVKTSDGRGRRMSNTWDLKKRRGARGRRDTGRIVPRRGGGFISQYGGGGANRGRVIPGRRRVMR